MKKLFKKIASIFLVALVGVSSVACAGGDIEQPDWLKDILCDHVFDEQEVLKEATCTEKGKVEKICSDCGKTEIVSTKKLPHVDENGDKTCDVCGTTISSDDNADSLIPNENTPTQQFNESERLGGWYRLPKYANGDSDSCAVIYFLISVDVFGRVVSLENRWSVKEGRLLEVSCELGKDKYTLTIPVQFYGEFLYIPYEFTAEVCWNDRAEGTFEYEEVLIKDMICDGFEYEGSTPIRPFQKVIFD